MRKEAFRKMIRLFRINNIPVEKDEPVQLYALAGDIENWHDNEMQLQVENFDYSNIAGLYLQFDRNGAERIIETLDAYHDVLTDSDNEEDRYGIPSTFSFPARWFGIAGSMVSRDASDTGETSDECIRTVEESSGCYLFDVALPDTISEYLIEEKSDALVEFDAQSEARLVMTEKGTGYRAYLSLDREFLDKVIHHIPEEKDSISPSY